MKIAQALLRNNSFKRHPQLSYQTNSSMKFLPQTTNHVNDTTIGDFNGLSVNYGTSLSREEDDKENQSFVMNKGLGQILKGTAKFKETQNKLEQSYNSLMGSFCGVPPNDIKENQKKQMEGTMHSFMSLYEGNADDLDIGMDDEMMRQLNGHSLSREEL